MALLWNHYEAAFEHFLREKRLPHVVVDEKRRALAQNSSLKSFDFIVYSQKKYNLLVDIKGRRFPSGGQNQANLWENWTTEDDMNCLIQWQEIFGSEFRSLLVFAYDILDSKWNSRFDSIFEYKERSYSFFGIWADEYDSVLRSRSPKWETVSISNDNFRRLREPIERFLE